MNFIPFASLTAPADLKQPDHLDRLREQRRDHMQSAMYWKRRYQAWGGLLALKWFLAEARSHRMVSRALWEKGTN